MEPKIPQPNDAPSTPVSPDSTPDTPDKSPEQPVKPFGFDTGAGFDVGQFQE